MKVSIRTDLIQLNSIKLGTAIAQQLFRSFAVWAVGFGEDGDGVLVDDGLDFGFCGGHCGW